MIPPEQIEQVKQACDIVTLISQKVVLKKRGKNFLGLCPFHSEKSPSFTVSFEKQFYHCFGCGAGGSVFDFVMKFENISFVEAVQNLAAEHNITISSSATPSTKIDWSSEKQILQIAHDFFVSQLKAHENIPALKNYLIDRKLGVNEIQNFHIGFAPDSWDGLYLHLQKNNVSVPKALDLGLLSQSENTGKIFDRFRARLVFPIHNEKSEVLGFGTRQIPGLGDANSAKYINSSESAMFNKSKTLYALHLALPEFRHQHHAILVEGYMDALRLHQFGFPQTVACMGTAFTLDQARLLKRHIENLYLCLDQDKAGQEASLRAIQICRELEIPTKVIVFASAKDCDELLLTQGKTAFEKAIAEAIPSIRYELDCMLKPLPQSAEEKQHLLEKILPYLRSLNSPILKKEYTQYVCDKIQVAREIVESALFEKVMPGTHHFSRMQNPKLNHSRVGDAQRKIIKAALIDLELRHRIRSISLSLFEDTLHAKTLTQILANASDTDTNLISALPEDTDIKKFLRELLFDLAPVNAIVLEDCIAVLLQHQKQLQIASLRAKLINAEKLGETQTVNDIMIQMQQLH
jgi:DNA primase